MPECRHNAWLPQQCSCFRYTSLKIYYMFMPTSKQRWPTGVLRLGTDRAGSCEAFSSNWDFHSSLTKWSDGADETMTILICDLTQVCHTHRPATAHLVITWCEYHKDTCFVGTKLKSYSTRPNVDQFTAECLQYSFVGGGKYHMRNGCLDAKLNSGSLSKQLCYT